MERKITLEELHLNPTLIKEIENPTEEQQLIAVKNTGSLIECIKEPTEAVQLEAIRKCALYFGYIHNPAYSIQLKAVKQWGRNIEYINEPSKQLQLMSVKQDVLAFLFINNPCVEVLKFVQKSKAIKTIREQAEISFYSLENKIKKVNDPIYLKKVIKGLENIL